MTDTSLSPHNEQQTRIKLLETAGLVFAEVGYQHATIRDICGRAGANIAAVNYHFGDKLSFYKATLRHWLDVGLQKYPPFMDVPESAGPEQRLLGFIRGYLFRILDDSPDNLVGRMIVREMADPVGALEGLMDSIIQPLTNSLENLVHQIVGPDIQIPPETLRHAVGSISGQCLFYKHARPFLDLVYPEQAYTPDDIERLALHIWMFSLAGLKDLRARLQTSS